MHRRGHSLSGIASAGVLFVVLGACQDVQPRVENSGGQPETSMSSGSAADTETGDEFGVRLEAVGRSRPEASLRTRDPFRFGQMSGGPGSPGNSGSTPVAAENPEFEPVPTLQTQPRVRLRMIGLVEAPDTVGRIAILTDGENVFHGREGDIVEGRYRIIVVGPVSVQVESVHDGERQTLRLARM